MSQNKQIYDIDFPSLSDAEKAAFMYHLEELAEDDGGYDFYASGVKEFVSKQVFVSAGGMYSDYF